MLPYYLALLGGVLIGVGAQILLKQGAGAPGSFVAQLFHPSTIIGLGLYGVAAMLYIVALRKIPLSLAFPSVAISYAVVALLGHVLWNEPLGWQQLTGIVLVIGGVALINQT